MPDSNRNIAIPENYLRIAGSELTLRTGSQKVSPADPKEKLTVTILIRRRLDAPALPDMEYWANVPPGKRRFISREEFATKYGADVADMDKIIKFTRSHDLELIEKSIAKRTIQVSGTVAQISKAFAIELVIYKTPKEIYRGRQGHVHLPKDIIPIVEGVFGLDNRKMAKPNGNLTTPQLEKLYNFPTTTATGQTIGILELSGGFYQSDLNFFFGTLNLTAPVPTVVSVDGVTNNPGVLGNKAADVEVALDIEVAGAVAQGAGIVLYFAPDTEQGWVDAVTSAIHDPVNKPSVLSISWGHPEGVSGEWTKAAMDAVDIAFREAAALGVTIFATSGDDGSRDYVADGNPHVDFPGSSPWVTGCGGTAIRNVSGTTFTEVTWNDSSGATGGGISDIFARPSWQMDVNLPNSANPTPGFPIGGGRGVPDIAGNASIYSLGEICVYGAMQNVDGTSAVAPLYAGLIAVINAAMGVPVGYLNPTLYAIAKTSGQTVIRDINDGASNKVGTAPGYTSTSGWDACTGLGVLDGAALLNSIQQGLSQDCYIIVDWEKIIKAGVDEMVAASTATPKQAVFNPAFYVVADGFTPDDLGIGTANPVKPSITFSPMPSGMHCKQVGGAVADGIPAVPNAPQRWTFTFEISFDNSNGFPATSGAQAVTVNASIPASVPGTFVVSSAIIDLVNQSGPFMSPGAESWLSNDIRVFQMEPGQSIAGLPSVIMGNTGNVQNDAITFIQNFIKALNTATSVDLFDPIPSDENASELDVNPTDTTKTPAVPVYNFAVARVRYQDQQNDAENVRVFFRLFPAASISVVYDQSSTYRRYSDDDEFGRSVPLLGIQQVGVTEFETIPFFAAPRVDTTTVSMDAQTDTPNARTILHDPGNAVVYGYYGCWLDINQPANVFPQVPVVGDDGPFTGPLTSVLGLINNEHQCLITEIAYDPMPIAPNSTPGTSPMLNQRNLVLGTAANPGDDAMSRRVSNAFQMQPTAASLHKGAMPDEIMIDWGNTPRGSTATLYLPAVNVVEIIERARTMYGHTKLSKTDSHTLHFPAEGISYLPIPKSDEGTLVALLSVDLPLGIKKGQIFKVIVRQLTNAEAIGKRSKRNKYKETEIEWRSIRGTFQITINVHKKEEMLAPEERLLPIFRWIEKESSKKSRWYPVLQRYVEQIALRVDALGGKAAGIKPPVLPVTRYVNN